ncbi:MAG: helix-turn-helix domain-containing protein [Promethearchaeota archaeon]
MEVPRLENIKILRDKIGWTQKDLAEKVGVGQSYIAKIENGKQEPSYKVVAEIFNCISRELQAMEGSELVIKDVATPRDALKFVGPKDKLSDVKGAIGDYDQIPVIDENQHCVGSVTSRVLIRLLSQETAEGTLVKEFMEAPLPSFSENTTIKQMREILRFIDAALIVDQDKITGIISRSDVF